MGLEKYREKRDFNQTPEPSGTEEHSGQSRFVIQRHDASRLHYDLRLEMEGVLKSWAVPKGPSMNPDDKRLAIHTEDHPLKYLKFQGTIPKGNYGAGEMTIWDQGTYTSYENPDDPEKLKKEYEDGTLHLLFQGHQVQGKFSLVKTNYGDNKDQWLLIKKDDENSVDEDYDAEDYPSLTDDSYSVSSDAGATADKEDESEDEERSAENGQSIEDYISLQNTISPMLASTAREPFDNPDWIFELKYDGYRVLANVLEKDVKLYSRNGISYNTKFPEVISELSSLSHEAILDGEMIVVDSEGFPSFQSLQNYEKISKGHLRYMIFDLLYLGGHSTMTLPLTQRKELLRDLLPEMKHVKYTDHISKDGRSFYESSIEQGLEGIMAKYKDSVYHPGLRSEKWLKIKQFQTADPVICGYTESEKSGRLFGSLILGMEKEDNLQYCGNCGTGFSHKKMNELYDRFQPLKKEESPFADPPDLKGRIPQWLSPDLVCEIKYSEITKDGRYRHPVFLRMRPDKKPSNPHLSTESPVISTVTTDDDTIEINGVNIALSNLDKIYWPESGLRKYDLLDYYISVSSVLIPHLMDRPQNLHRHPDGIGQPGFYQKNQENLPDWIPTVKVHSDSTDKDINYLLCQDEATLLYLVNLGCIEINPWLARSGSLDHPDYGVIDLDPSPSNTFAQVIETSLAFKEVLDHADIRAWIKTSGSRGLHIYIPMGAAYTFDQARDFVRLICVMVHKKLPGLTTMERTLRKRGPKIYLDYLQNRRGQTIVAPYSVRPVSGAWVSAPVTWQELEEGVELQDFNIHTIPGRVEDKEDLFSELLDAKTDMMLAIEKLEQNNLPD